MSSKLEESLAQEIKLHGLPTPERQFKFHPTRKFRADFCFVDQRIIVECDGGLFIQGRHSRGATQERDHEKRNLATRAGYRVFIFGPKALRVPKRSGQPSKALEFLRGVLQ